MREAFPKKGKAVLVLIHLIKTKPRSSNQQKLQFYSDSCNWTKSERVRVFTDQARAGEGSGGNVLAQWELHTSAVCTRQCKHWKEGLESLSIPRSSRWLCLGNTSAELMFIWCFIVLTCRWWFLLLVEKVSSCCGGPQGLLLPEKQVPRTQICPVLPLPLASGDQFTFWQLSFAGCGRGSSSTGTVGTGWYGNVLRATTAWKHVVIIH